MTQTREQMMISIARTRYNIDVATSDDIPPRIKGTIARRFVLPSEGSRKPMTEEEKYQRRLAESNAQRAIHQQLEQENPSTPASAREQRVELLESRLGSHDRANPGQRRRLERELKEAKAEVQAERVEAQAEAEKLAFAQQLQQHSSYANAIQHSQASLALAETSGNPEEIQEAIVAQRLLQQVTSMNEVDHRLTQYWHQEANRREREVLKEMEKANETTRTASEAVKLDSDQQTRMLDAQRDADAARQNAEGGDNE